METYESIKCNCLDGLVSKINKRLYDLDKEELTCEFLGGITVVSKRMEFEYFQIILIRKKTQLLDIKRIMSSRA
jgi:hypothetical protein